MKILKRNIARKPKAATIRKACESAHPKPNPQREAAHISSQSGFVPQNPPSSNDGVRDSPPEAGSRKPESGIGFVSQNPPLSNDGARNSPPGAVRAPASPSLHPQKSDETVRSVRLESAEGATESCCRGQRESASAARGNVSSNLQAPMAAAEASASYVTREAGTGFVSQNGGISEAAAVR